MDLVNAKKYGFKNLKVKEDVVDKIWKLFKDEEILDGLSLSEFLDIIVSDPEIMRYKLEKLKSNKNKTESGPMQ